MFSLKAQNKHTSVRIGKK